MAPVHPRPRPLLDPRPALDSLLAEPSRSSARAWLADAVERVTAEPAARRALFPAVRRHCGGGSLDEYWSVDEAARAALLAALPLRGGPLAHELTGLYRHGDPAERRAVLRTLGLLDRPGAIGEHALPLVRAALRGNDVTVIEAALGAYAADRLPAHEYRHAILACVFLALPLERVCGLAARADAELARMLADFAHERLAAGRDVPDDVWPLVRAFPGVAARLAAAARTVPADRHGAVVRALTALDAGPEAVEHPMEEA